MGEPQYPPELFRGTAQYYARFRPRYPAVLLDAVRTAVNLEQAGALLDLACGTGEVALAFADSVEEIWAIDAEAEMITLARSRASARGVERIHWLVGRAEDAEPPRQHFGLVVTGRAFHRLNRPLVARRCLDWLRPGGYFVDLGADSSGLFSPSEPWLVAAAEVYRQWLPRSGRSARSFATPKATSQDVLCAAGFLEVAKYEFSARQVWEIDQFIGYLSSTSYSSRRFWGESWDGFAHQLRETLAGFAVDGCLTETISAYFVVGRKP
ncbi:MAG TPA: class I SAM-dependent methyltransferase [Jatrophihabitans sp.]|nr:class I SAM-dependent methyltransferase [Jatrophihabitans sp.]